MPRPATAPGFHDRVSGLPESHLPTSLRNVQPEPEAAAEYKTPNTFRRSHTAGLAAFGLPEQGPPSWAGEIRLGLETARPTTRIRGCSCAPPPQEGGLGDSVLCTSPVQFHRLAAKHPVPLASLATKSVFGHRPAVRG